MSRGFITQSDFWEKEGDSPILKFNLNDWLQNHVGEATAHAQTWITSLGLEPSKMDFDDTPLKAEGARIFRADANRTFRSEPNREIMIKLLSFSQLKFGDYQQSLGYVAGVLLIFFDPATVTKMLTVLNDSPRYLTGYWRGEATAVAVDGYVCFNLLRQPIKDKMMQLGLLPETYVQKWFAGICIHHLPYKLLFPFLDNFFKFGNKYLFQFYLAFFDEFEQDIMSAKSNPEANMLIRFESAPEPRLEKVVHAALESRYVDVIAKVNLFQARCDAFEQNLSRRMSSANEGMWARRDDDITFSDEED